MTKPKLSSNLQRKLFSVLAAFIIWAFVNASITTTRVFHRVPVRIVNLPPDMTVRGLLPDGFLDKHLTLTLTGARDVLDKIDSGDFEVVIDAANKASDSVIYLSHKNLVSLNPDIDFMHSIKKLAHGDIILKMSHLVTEKIPVFVQVPVGEPPDGYQFLGVWPHRLTHTVSGPEEDVRELQKKGLELTLDMGRVSQEDLDALSLIQNRAGEPDEVSFFVPDSWKQVHIPFLKNLTQEANGPEAKALRIDFLRKELLPIDRVLPIRVFYPLPTIAKINPLTFPLEVGGPVSVQDDVTVIRAPLFAKDVSRLFLDIVRDRLEIVVIANASTKKLDAAVQFIDTSTLEDTYVARLQASGKEAEEWSGQTAGASHNSILAKREQFLRGRFRDYMQHFSLYWGTDRPFMLDVRREARGIVVHATDAGPSTP